MAEERITITFSSLQNSIKSHCIRASVFSRIIAEHTKEFFSKYNEENLPEMYSAIMDGALYHDIGKIYISNYLLNKTDDLSDYELIFLQQHPIMTEQILLREKVFAVPENEYKKIVTNMGKYHHENFDGSGYPCGLAGKAIPTEAQICAIANTFDAFISKRGYKKAYLNREAVTFIKSSTNTLFSPSIVDAFLQALPEIADISAFSKKI